MEIIKTIFLITVYTILAEFKLVPEDMAYNLVELKQSEEINQIDFHISENGNGVFLHKTYFLPGEDDKRTYIILDPSSMQNGTSN